MAREYRDLYFWDLFFHRIYLFIEDSLAISRFSRTLTLVLPLTLTIIAVFARTLTFVCILTLNIVCDLSQNARRFFNKSE